MPFTVYREVYEGSDQITRRTLEWDELTAREKRGKRWKWGTISAAAAAAVAAVTSLVVANLGAESDTRSVAAIEAQAHQRFNEGFVRLSASDKVDVQYMGTPKWITGADGEPQKVGNLVESKYEGGSGIRGMHGLFADTDVTVHFMSDCLADEPGYSTRPDIIRTLTGGGQLKAVANVYTDAEGVTRIAPPSGEGVLSFVEEGEFGALVPADELTLRTLAESECDVSYNPVLSGPHAVTDGTVHYEVRGE